MIRGIGLLMLSVPGLAVARDSQSEFADTYVHPDAMVLTAQSLGTGTCVGDRALIDEGIRFGAGAVVPADSQQADSRVSRRP